LQVENWSQKLIAKSYRYELTAVAFATLLALVATNVQALTLGRITVQSALGEALQAEIDIPDITDDEAGSLKAQVALPSAYKTAGMDYSPVLPGVKMVLQKRPDGRSYLRISSDRLVQEPFVDLILEASWNTGRILRDYTMLFDPPTQRPAAPPVVVPLLDPGVAQLPRSTPRPESLSAPSVAPSVAAAARQATPQGSDTKPAQVSASATGQKVVVRPGEIASRIAIAHKPSNVSLDQMLVAMQKTNPNAFIEGNVNRMKAGAILALPSAEQASLITPGQASQIITAQSRDFNRFRQALAANAAVDKQPPADRNISGTIQAKVDDKSSSAQTPDKLTLSQGAVKGASDLEQMALARNAQASADRAAQINQNTEELNQLAKMATSIAGSGAASASKTESAAASTPALGPTSAVSGPAVQATAAPPASATAPATVPASETGFLDEMIANPLMPAGAAAVILLLAGLGFYKVRQRKQNTLADSSFMESGSPEPFFGSPGDQSVGTSKSETLDALIAPGAVQPDAADELDSLAQAEVCLAYGRDVQAEEILKDALLDQPERLAVHQKLLAIYAKRKDPNAYSNIATLAKALTQGTGPEWAQICSTGLALEPGNVLYLSGGVPTSQPASFPKENLPADSSEVRANVPPVVALQSDQGNGIDLDMDLDLDFSVDKPVTSAGEKPAVDVPSVAQPPEIMSFDLDSFSLDLDDSKAAPTEAAPEMGAEALDAKLALAEEFRANGDEEGARELLKQVISEADGLTQAKAQLAPGPI
jgi:pilus assembly protein FimV